MAADAAEFKGERFDAVIHFGNGGGHVQETLTDPQRANASRDRRRWTRRALEIATGATGARGGFSSRAPEPCMDASRRVSTGFLKGIPSSRASRCDSSPYAIGGDAKRRAERLCQDAGREAGLGAVIARCFTFAGPVLPTGGKFAFGNFLEGRPPPVEARS